MTNMNDVLARCRPLICLLILLFATPASAIGTAESDDGEYSLDAIGSQRFLGAYLHYPDVPGFFPTDDDGLTASVTRLMLEGYLGSVTDYEINLYADLSRTPATAMGGAFATAGAFRTPYRTPYLDWEFWESGSVTGELGIDRLALSFDVSPVQVGVGRMPVNYSVTSIFTPNDFFAPFSATAINKIYKPGVDALRLNFATGTLSSVELVGVLGSDADGTPGWGESALVARVAMVGLGLEWALLGGKLARRWIAGASLQGEAGPISIRTEGHAGFPDTDGSEGMDDLDNDGRVADGFHVRLAVGADAAFAWRNATVGAEYMFVSDGESDPALYLARANRFFPDDQPYLGMHYTGISAGLDLAPILRLQAAALLNAVDLSGLGMLTLVYNIADEADFMGGVLAPWGDRSAVDEQQSGEPPSILSEYGMLPLMAFLETRFYF